jgi:hypothetical protein
MQQVRETGEMHKGFCWRDLRKTDHMEHLGLDGRIILKRIRKKWNEGVWTGLIWLRTRDRWRTRVNAAMKLPWSQELLGMWMKIGRDSK